MEAITFFLSYVTPYVAFVVFVGGITYRLIRWRQRGPVAAHLSLFPRPRGALGKLVDTGLDILTLRGLSRVNRALWIGGAAMHLGLLLLFMGHVRLVTDYYFLWGWLNWGKTEQHQFSAIAGVIAGFLFMLPLFYLLARRLAGGVKSLSTPEDFFVLFLLLGIAITGNHMRLVLDPNQHAIRDFMQGLILFRWKPVPSSAGASFIYHFAMVQLLMIYFPFGKLMHTIGLVFSKLVARS